MKVLRVFLAVMFIVFLSATQVSAEEKGSYKGLSGRYAQTRNITASGNINFADYYSMGGEKCAAFMETEDGDLLCVLDNIKASKLKNAIGGKGKVKLMGTMKKGSSGHYVTIDEYEIIEKTPVKKGSGYESKGSERKGS